MLMRLHALIPVSQICRKNRRTSLGNMYALQIGRHDVVLDVIIKMWPFFTDVKRQQSARILRRYGVPVPEMTGYSSLLHADHMAWTAGVVDGEGYFGRSLRLVIAQSSFVFGQPPQMLVRIAELFDGGRIVPLKDIRTTREPWQYTLNGSRVTALFTAIEPYLCGPKKAQFQALIG
jgi:hypothetical protein